MTEQRDLPEPKPRNCCMGRLKPCKKCGADVWGAGEDEYGSLADGGSYERFECGHCQNTIYVELRYRLRRQIHSAIDALAAQAVPAAVTRISIPTETMEQEFQWHYSRGYKAGVAASTPAAPAQPVAWQPIETAPKNNRRPLYLARFDECGKLSEIASNGGWEFWQESYEMPDVCGYDWVSDGGIENPTHWAYQTTADGLSTVAPPTERGPSSSSPEKDL